MNTINYNQDRVNFDGYSSIKEKSNTIASALEDISVLIGESKEESIDLKLGGHINQPGLSLLENAGQLNKLAQDIHQGIFKVIVLGEFKNGKSTLLNAILGDKVLIAKAMPATAIITVLVSGNNKKVAIYETDNSTPRYITIEEYKKEFGLSPKDIETLKEKKFFDRFEKIEYAQMECLNRLCENGVKLIDSPGLGEQASRTKVTTSYLPQAQAVIFLLNATKILSEAECDFIENQLGDGRLENVFFVINRINLVGDEEDVKDIKDWVKAKLEHHFLDVRGNFDEEFYNRRVFFVNAFGALDARITIPEDEEELAASGVPDFERELEIFLTSDGKNTAAFQSSFQSLTAIVNNSCESISQRKIALEEPLAKLEKNRAEAEKRLQALEREKEEIEQTILRFGEVISGKIFANLMTYVSDMQKTWPQDSERLINLDEVGVFKILKSAVTKGGQEKIKQTIKSEVENYLREKLKEWAEKVPTIVSEDVEKMTEAVQAQVEDFQLELRQISNVFLTGELLSSYELDTEKGKVSKIVQGLVNIWFLDISGLTGTLMGTGNWGSFLARILLDLLIFGVVSSVATPIVGLIVYLLLEIGHTLLQGQGFKKRLLKTIGEKLHANLPTEMSKQHDTICTKIQQQFANSAQRLTQHLQAQIEEKRSEQEKILQEKGEASFSVEKEKKRLDTINSKLVELFNLAGIAIGKSPEELTKLLEAND